MGLSIQRGDATKQSRRVAVQGTAPSGQAERGASQASRRQPQQPPPRPTRFSDRVLETVLKHRLVLDLAMLGAGVAIAPIAGAIGWTVGPVIAGRGTGTGIAWGSVFVVSTLIVMRIRRLYDFRLQLNLVEDASRIVSATSTGAILLIALRVIANSVNGAANQAFRLWAGSTVCLIIGRAGLAAPRPPAPASRRVSVCHADHRPRGRGRADRAALGRPAGAGTAADRVPGRPVFAGQP